MMLLAALVTLSCTLVLCFASPLADTSKHDVGILYPGSTSISDHSYTVAVLSETELLGGGALVTQSWVLTAASNVHGLNISNVQVRVGSNSAYDGGTIHRVLQIVEHPMYEQDSTYNLALIKLDTPVYPKVARYIELARIPFNKNGISGNTTGFGITSTIGQGYTSSQLQVSAATINKRENCYNYLFISPRWICGSYGASAPCFGDTGNPLVWCANSTMCKLVGIYNGMNPCNKYSDMYHMDLGQFYYDFFQKVIQQ